MSEITDLEQALGKFIHEQNPYTNVPWGEGAGQQSGEMLLGPQWQTEKTETFVASKTKGVEPYPLWWNFKGEQCRVVKAIRIEYTYIKEDGRKITEHLLIGYEGSGGE